MGREENTTKANERVKTVQWSSLLLAQTKGRRRTSLLDRGWGGLVVLEGGPTRHGGGLCGAGVPRREALPQGPEPLPDGVGEEGVE